MIANIDGVASPPPELAAHVDAAASAFDSLEARGERVAFEEATDGRLQIHLRDDDENDLGVLSCVELFDLIDQEGGVATSTLDSTVAGDWPVDERSAD
ncbi:MAG TPA: hypothetical protein VHM72_06965 [Solirubrobacteraceae bacterium]|nr:hypothetical protein [Solirubrobacteraceae bacterium]